jgi:stage II sporulation protein P
MILVSVGLIVGLPRKEQAQVVPAISGAGRADETVESTGSLLSRIISRLGAFVRPRSSGTASDRSDSTREMPPGDRDMGGLAARALRAAMGAMGGLDPEDPRTFVRAELPAIVRPARLESYPARSSDARVFAELREGTLPVEAPWQVQRAGSASASGGGGADKGKEVLRTGDSGSNGATEEALVQASSRAETLARAPEERPESGVTIGEPESRSPSSPSPAPAPAKQRDQARPEAPTALAMRRVSDNLSMSGTKPRVAILHTHSSEAYRKSWGADYCWGKSEGVIAVGAVMADELSRAFGTSTVHSTKIHDYPDWSKSYVNSLVTMKYLVGAYPSLETIVDIHRDSLPANLERLRTTTVDGKKVARVLIVVTEESSALAHPNWRKNYQFALKLDAELDRLYPGVSRGVARYSHSRFNQHVHDRAIIIEIGGTDNTREEAERSARLVARALVNIL